MPSFKLLVVEDDVHVAKVLEARLMTFGYEVCSIAASGSAAVRKAFEHQPDLILMDILLEGGMNGIEAAELIRTRMDVPIVFVTCLNDQRMLDRAIKTNAYGYIRKPYDIAELKYTLQIALSQHRAAIAHKHLMAERNPNPRAREAEEPEKTTLQPTAAQKWEPGGGREHTGLREGRQGAIKDAHPDDMDDALSGIQLLLSLMLKNNGNEMENELMKRDPRDHAMSEESLKKPQKSLRSYWGRFKDRLSKSIMSFSP